MSPETLPLEETKNAPKNTPKKEEKLSRVSEAGYKIYNKSRRNIELDFGRDKELRIAAFETVDLPSEYIEHPALLAEAQNFDIINKRG